jgi:FAD/FMN-containing dehydrogenase
MSDTDLSTAIGALSASFSGRLLLPASPGYDDARRVHNGLIDKRPAAIAQCLGSADVSDALALARAHGLEVAVRGGGHNVGGRATIDAGLMIDLSMMKGLHVDARARTARAEGGTTWKEFNRATLHHGLAGTGGVVSSTGVAGLTLGGGFGWLMPKHGMAMDNLRSVDLVLADGRPVRAAGDENPDLFWAVRGGGGNFGVATSFEFNVHPLGELVTGGLVAHPIARARDVLRLFRDLAGKAPDDMMLVAALLTGPDGSTKLVGVAAGHMGPLEAGAAAVAPLKAYGPPIMDVLGPIPYGALNAMLDGSFPKGARNYWKSHFMTTLTDEAIDALIDAFMSAPSPMCQILLEHFHGAATRVAPTATAYAMRSPGFNMLVLSQWMNPADDAAGIGWARRAYDRMRPFVGANRYLNYLNPDDAGDEALVAAYGPNVERLRQLKAKYDPENVFRHNVNIKPGT